MGAEEGAEPRRWVERRGGRRLGRGGRAERRACPELGGGAGGGCGGGGPDERPEVADEAPGAPMGGCVGAQHDSSGSLNENSEGTGGR